MTPEQRNLLLDIGIRVEKVEYSYRNCNLEQFGLVEDEPIVTMKILCDANLETLSQIELDLRILARARNSDNAAIKDLLNQLKTTLGIIE